HATLVRENGSGLDRDDRRSDQRARGCQGNLSHRFHSEQYRAQRAQPSDRSSASTLVAVRARRSISPVNCDCVFGGDGDGDGDWRKTLGELATAGPSRRSLPREGQMVRKLTNKPTVIQIFSVIINVINKYHTEFISY